MKLDIQMKYEYQDAFEVFWKFVFDKIGEEEGWWAWVKRPENKEYFCVGLISEQELIKRLEATPKPLTPDDLIDLELWLQHGGLDQYKPKKRRKKKEVNE